VFKAREDGDGPRQWSVVPTRDREEMGVDRRDHDIVVSIHHEGPLPDVLKFRISLPAVFPAWR
jgi:hypothetical protein